MDKTCKSNDHCGVAIFRSESGARVRNAWAIYREAWNNSLKGELIPDVIVGGHPLTIKAGDRKAWHFAMSPRPIR